MPELPEVEAVVRRLEPLVTGRTIRSVAVRAPRTIRPASVSGFARALTGARIEGLARRGKCLLFSVCRPRREPTLLVGHLGMTGRMAVEAADAPLPGHVVVLLGLGGTRLTFQDVRRFGRLTLGDAPIRGLGPEPLGDSFDDATFADALGRSRRPVKVLLLDQSVIAGVGNIYASEALYRAGLSPARRADRVSRPEAVRLRDALRAVLAEAVERQLSRMGAGPAFHHPFGGEEASAACFQVYERAGMPCGACASAVRRIVQVGRSSYFCPRCQH
jgi:formamidopyrimidine-DNA glycosylase